MRVLLLLTALSVCFSVYSQEKFTPAARGYYVIVGTFAVKKNAARLTSSLVKQGVSASYGFLESRNLFYVYTHKDEDASVCIKEATTLRQQEQYADAWVRFIEGVTPEKDTVHAITKAIVEEPVQKIIQTPASEEVIEESEPEAAQEIIQHEKVTLGNTEVFLSLYNSRNDRVAEGKVEVIDTDRGRSITQVPGNTYLILPDPKSKSGELSLICDVVGYRKIQKEINFNNPTADSTFITYMGTSLVANFELVQYQKGDIRTLYNIYFFNDAAIMMPESKFELNSLLQMMMDNPNFRIRLHGHSNGNYSGKIIKRGNTGDFFSVAVDANTTIGTAKQLSDSRAQAIADYLVANGVEASRVEVKAWGGKRPLYDKKGPQAKKNIRVEVEVIGS